MVLTHKIDRFITSITLGVQFFQEAGTQLVQMLEENPRVMSDILDHAKQKHITWLTVDVLHTFEQVGRKQLAVEAMFLPRYILDRMIALPVDQQTILATQPVRVLTGQRQGRHHVELKPVSSLSRREAVQVLGPNGARSPEEQAHIAETRPKRVLGRFTIQYVNGKAWIKNSSGTRLPVQRIILKPGGAETEIELVEQ